MHYVNELIQPIYVDVQAESDLNILSGAESLVILSGTTGYYDLSVRPLRRGSYSGVIAFVARDPSTTYVLASFLISDYVICCDVRMSNDIGKLE